MTRCVPQSADGSPPAPDALTGVSLQLNADAWALWNGLRNRLVAGELLLRGCRKPRLVSASPITPSGGCAGWTLTIITDLDTDEALGL